MGFRQANSKGIGGYARVFKAENMGKFSSVNLATSKKDAESGEYVTDFQSGFVSFIGQAHTKIQEQEIGEKGLPIQILSCDVTIHHSDDGKYYTNYTVFDFNVNETKTVKNEEYSKSSGKTAKKPVKKKEPEDDASEEEDEDLPF